MKGKREGFSVVFHVAQHTNVGKAADIYVCSDKTSEEIVAFPFLMGGTARETISVITSDVLFAFS